MANTIVPSQLGYTAPNSTNGSQVFIGKDTLVSFEAIGLGQDGRPDYLEHLKINISRLVTQDESLSPQTVCSISINVNEVISIISNENYPSTNNVKDVLQLKLREFAVCEDTDGDGVADEEKKVVMLASQSY